MNRPTEPTKNIRVAIYTRKSVADTERKEFGSIEAQRKACEAFILSREGLGWKALEKHYDDYGFSGKDLNRDAFKELIADCEAGLVDHVCCYRLDRLSRSPRDFADMNDKFTSLGIGYTSVTESFIDASTPMGRMMIQVILGFAQCERETSQERVKHFFSEARSLGRFLGGPTPYGYRCEKSKLYADPQTAPFVERIFNIYITKQGSTKQTAVQLNAEGVPRPNGQPWNPRAVVTVVRCPRYAGLAKNAEGELIKGDQEPLISRTLWDRAQRLVKLTLTGQRGRQPTVESSLMKDLITCGHCGGAMGYRFSSRKNMNKATGEERPGRKRYAYYDCVIDKKRAVSTCPVRSVSYEHFVGLLEQQLEKALCASLALTTRATAKAGIDLRATLAALGKPSTLFPGLDPFNRRALIRALVRNVRVFETTIDITLDLMGLGVSPTDVSLPDADRDDTGNLIVRVPVKFSHVSGRKKIETAHPTEFQTNSPILRAIARGMAWLRMLDEGKVSSIHDLADTLKLERKYVRYTLRLAFLSPRVIRAIMQGQEPDGLSLAALRRLTTANWSEQEKFLGLTKQQESC